MLLMVLTEQSPVKVLPIKTDGIRCGFVPRKPDDIDIEIASISRAQMMDACVAFFKWEINDAKRKKEGV